MLEIPNWLLIVAEQFFIVLIILTVVFFLRARKFRRLAQRCEDSGEGQTSATKENPPPASDLKEFGIVKEKLALAEQRVRNLERFRDMFFDLKDRIAQLMQQQQEMSIHMQQAGLPLEEQQALMSSFEKLKHEKEILEQHLQQIESELDMLMDNPATPPQLNVEDVNASGVIQQQQATIGKLIQEIADLELEAASRQRIQAAISEVNTQSDDLVIAIEVLQDENQFLSDQIQALLSQQRAQDRQLAQEVDLITDKLAQKQHDYDELYERHVNLESEYLKSQQ